MNLFSKTKKFLFLSGCSAQKILLAAVLALAFFLRTYQITKVPPHLNRDEASMAYNAYSILKTGRDEYGNLFPISIKSFGDYKLPVATYILIPFIAVFGLQDWVVRLPAALAGTATVFIIFLLSKRVFSKNKNPWLPLIIALLLALNPWHFYFSRALYEVGFELLFLSLACLFFIDAMEKKQSLLKATLFFALSLLTYHGAHIFTPLFFFSLIYFYRKKLIYLKNFKWSLVLFILVFSLTFGENLLHGYKARVGSQTLLDSPYLRYTLVERRINEHENQKSWQAHFFHNYFLTLPYHLSRNYLLSFSPDFLFFKGGSVAGQNLEDFGNFFLAEGVLIILGAYFLIKKRSKYRHLVFLWIFITPLVSVFTTEVPHSPRNFTLVVPFIVLAGFGLYHLLKKKGLLIKISLILLTLAYTHSLLIYLESYFYHLPLYKARYWDYGYKQVVSITNQHPEVQKIVMDNPEDFPYIYFLVYNSYPPKKFQDQVEYYSSENKHLAGAKKFDKYYFETVSLDNLEKNTLYFFKNQQPPYEVKEKGQITMPRGEVFLNWFIL